MKYLNKFIKGLSENVEIKNSNNSNSIYYNIDNFKIRLSDHCSPIITSNLDLSIIKLYNTNEFIVLYKDTRIPLMLNRRKTNDYIRTCLLNDQLLNKAKEKKGIIENKNTTTKIQYSKEIFGFNKIYNKKKYDINKIKTNLSDIEFIFYKNAISYLNEKTLPNKKLFSMSLKKYSIFKDITDKSLTILYLFGLSERLNTIDIINMFIDDNKKTIIDDEYVYNVIINNMKEGIFNKKSNEEIPLNNFIKYIKYKFSKICTSKREQSIRSSFNLIILNFPFTNKIRELIINTAIKHKLSIIDVISMFYNLTYKEKSDDIFMKEYIDKFDFSYFNN